MGLFRILSCLRGHVLVSVLFELYVCIYIYIYVHAVISGIGISG